MFNRYIIAFDNSQENVPVLMVGQEDNGFYGLSCTPSMKIINIITGDKAVSMRKELTEKAKEQEGDKDDKTKS